MAEHLTMVALRRALSARAGVSEKVADDFLNNLFGGIQEGLQKDGSVSVSGLGTFKLQEMPARESVNVTTGERITIKGYKKVVFVEGTHSAPAKKADEPIDPIQKLGEQAEEIKGILSELGAMEGSVSGEPSAEDSLSDSSHQEVETEQPAEPASTEQPQQAPKEEEKKTKKPFNAWLTGLITVAVFALLLVIAYFVLRHQIVAWADGMRTTIEERVGAPESKDVENCTDLTDQTDATEQVNGTEQMENVASDRENTSLSTEKTEQTEPAKPSVYNDADRKFTEFQATETVGQDSRLAWVAKKHYGEKALWVFVYEANRDKLDRPDHVLPGMQLRIPKLPKELRDVNNPQTKELLERLSKEYLGVH